MWAFDVNAIAVDWTAGRQIIKQYEKVPPMRATINGVGCGECLPARAITHALPLHGETGNYKDIITWNSMKGD